MPEGPEVEITARELRRALTGRRLAIAHLDGQRLAAAGALDQTTVTAVSRAGKWIGVHHRDGTVWLHLGMSGRIALAPAPAPPAHTRLAITTVDAGPSVRAALVDPRRFSRAASGEVPPGPALGPDVLVDPLAAAQGLTGRQRVAKALLLDPAVIAGVGNYLADEALHAAGVHPAARRLDAPTAEALAAAAGAVAAHSLTLGGMSMRDWAAPDGTAGRMLAACAVFRRAPGACRRCGTDLVSGQVASRTTTWCPDCQPVSEPTDAESPAAGMWPHPARRGRSRA